MQNYVRNASRDVPLTVGNVWYFQFPLGQGAHMFVWRKKTKPINFYWVSFCNISFYDYNVIHSVSQLTRDHKPKCDKSKHLSDDGSVKNNL